MAGSILIYINIYIYSYSPMTDKYPWAELTSVFAPKVKVFVAGRVARAGGWLAIL